MRTDPHYSRMRAAALFIGLFTVACTQTTKQGGGLELILRSDLDVPQAFDAVHVEISQQTSAGWDLKLKHDFAVGGGSSTLGTLSVAAGSSPDQEALIDVTAVRGGSPVIFSETLVQIPTDRLAELVILLGKACVGKFGTVADGGIASSCPMSQTCDPKTGGCVPTAIDSATLPTFSPGDVPGNAAGEPSDGGSDGPVDATVARPDVGRDAEAGAPAAGDSGAGDSGCASPAVTCNGVCVTLASNLRNCGVCGNDCTKLQNVDVSGVSCTNGRCAYVCAAGYEDCGDAGAGCSTSLGSTASCGACGVTCGGATGLCGQGDAGAYACGSACGSGQSNCNGTCADLTSNTTHCGLCGIACSAANATSACRAGACAVAACAPGFADCDKKATNGCEVDTTSDVSQCGGCGAACNVAHATAVCKTSACAVASCDPGYADCDKLASTGCEVSTASDPKNCGGCGIVCALANATATCSKSACAIASCNPGFADCDGIAANGCETDLSSKAHCGGCASLGCSGGTPICSVSGTTYACVSGCPAGSILCPGGACVNTASDANNCGSCGKLCKTPNATATCASSSCAVASCTAPFADCDGLAANGCEINVNDDPANCGTCHKACALPSAIAACTGGTCGIASCAAGFADCDHLTPDGCEVDLTSNKNNCGACGKVCALSNAAPTCTGSQCAIASCNSGFADCDGKAANGCEASLTSTSNCGTCGKACAFAHANSTCATGTCALASCAAGFADCNGTAADGCEINLTADGAHCGTCTTSCAVVGGTGSCTAGHCSLSSCNGGLTNCSGSCVDLQGTDSSNCGACGHSCQGGTCSGGRCQPILLASAGGSNIAVDSLNVYWINDSAAAVQKCAVGGCGGVPTTLASMQNTPRGLTADSRSVYWTDFGNPMNFGSVMTCGVGGCGSFPTTLVASEPLPDSVVVQGTTLFYTSVDAALANGQVSSCVLPGCASPVVVTTTFVTFTGGYHLAADASNVYWTADPGNGPNGGSVLKCAASGCSNSPSVLASVQNSPSAIAVSGGSVYWVNQGDTPTDGMVMKCAAVRGCNNQPTVLASSQALPNGIAVDSSNVYWTTNVGVMRCAVGGCVQPTIVAVGAASAVALDSTSVYWTTSNGGSVMKIAK